MSIAVELPRLAETLQRYGYGYLLTSPDGGAAPHAVAVNAALQGGDLVVTDAGRRTRANAQARPAVGLVWPPAAAGGYSLIVDGQAAVADDGTLRIAPERAVLHRAAPAGAVAPPGACGADCIEIGRPAAAAAGPTFDPAGFAQRQLDAYNARDLERFLREYTDDVAAYRIGSSEPFLAGKAAFGEHYRTQRFSQPGLHAELVSRMVFGNKVIDQERVVGVEAEPMEVAAIYEVTPAGIAKVWFVSGR